MKLHFSHLSVCHLENIPYLCDANNVTTDMEIKSIKNVFRLAKKALLALSAIILLTGCATKSQTLIVSCNYDDKKDITNYWVFPRGEVNLPGKWDRVAYNESSGQQFFMNPDSSIVAVAFPRPDEFEFNADGALKGNDFLKAFYDWESEYFKSYGIETPVIETDTVNHYIIFRALNNKYDSYFLFGERNGHISNLSMDTRSSKRLENEIVKFLKDLFLKD